MESKPLESLLELWERVGGEDDHRVLVAVGLQPLRVEMIPMQVADVEVIGGPEGGVVELVVSGVREPAGVIRRIEPGVAQDRAVRGVDLDSGLIGDVNRCTSRLISERNLRFEMESLKVYQSDHETVQKLKDLIEKAQDTNVANQYREQAEKISQQMSGNIKAREIL
jgi:hypothetical protein